MNHLKLLTAARRVLTDDRGVTAVEYGVLGALIIVVCIAVITTLGTTLQGTFTTITGAL